MAKLNLYDPTGDLRATLEAIARREKLLDQRGNPSASQAVAWLVTRDTQRDGKRAK